jgi:hypothetical protein
MAMREQLVATYEASGMQVRLLATFEDGQTPTSSVVGSFDELRVSSHEVRTPDGTILAERAADGGWQPRGGRTAELIVYPNGDSQMLILVAFGAGAEPNGGSPAFVVPQLTIRGETLRIADDQELATVDSGCWKVGLEPWPEAIVKTWAAMDELEAGPFSGTWRVATPSAPEEPSDAPPTNPSAGPPAVFMRARWPRVPADPDELARFAVEFEIEARHALERWAELWEREGATFVKEPAWVFSTPMVSAQPFRSGSVSRVTVRLTAPDVKWEIHLKEGRPYEAATSLVERFAFEILRLEDA